MMNGGKFLSGISPTCWERHPIHQHLEDNWEETDGCDLNNIREEYQSREKENQSKAQCWFDAKGGTCFGIFSRRLLIITDL